MAGERGTLLYELYWYKFDPKRVWLLSDFGLLRGLDFDPFWSVKGHVFYSGWEFSLQETALS